MEHNDDSCGGKHGSHIMIYRNNCDAQIVGCANVMGYEAVDVTHIYVVLLYNIPYAYGFR